MEWFPVRWDAKYYHAFPDVTRWHTGTRVCVISACVHHSDRSYSRIVLRSSSDRGGALTRTIPTDFDHSPWSDAGCSGWVQFPDGGISISSYIVDERPRDRIRGYSLRPDAFLLPPA